jgi:hypothetical protein
MTSGGVAGDGGIDGSVVSLILRIMPQVSSGRDRATAVRSLRDPSAGGAKLGARRPMRDAGLMAMVMLGDFGVSGYGCAGASEGATDSGMCDGPGPPNPPWNPAP